MGEDMVPNGPKSKVFRAGTPRDTTDRCESLHLKPQLVVGGRNATTVISSIASTAPVIANNSNDIGNSSSSSSAAGSPVNDSYGRRNYGLNISDILNCSFFTLEWHWNVLKVEDRISWIAANT